MEPGIGGHGPVHRARRPAFEASRNRRRQDARSTRPHRAVLLDATTGELHPFWAELDANADPGTTPLLLLHPAVNFPDGHRIVVGLRNLVNTAGKPIAATPTFAAYRDGLRTTDPAFEQRRPAMERVFADLARVGHRSRQPAAGVGLHGREHEQPHRSDDRDPRRRVRVSGESRARLHGHEGHRESE